MGVVDIAPEDIERKGRLMPGNIFLVDFEEGRVITDAELKAKVSNARPYGDWLSTHTASLAELVASVPEEQRAVPSVALAAGGGAEEEARDGSGVQALLRPLKQFGYTQESFDVVLGPMVRSGADPLGSMGNDAPLAAMSSRPKLLPEYFKQLFAQVRFVAFLLGSMPFADWRDTGEALTIPRPLHPCQAPIDDPTTPLQTAWFRSPTRRSTPFARRWSPPRAAWWVPPGT